MIGVMELEKKILKKKTREIGNPKILLNEEDLGPLQHCRVPVGKSGMADRKI